MSRRPTRRGRPATCETPSKITDRRHDVEIDTESIARLSAQLRGGRTASWRCVPLRDGRRDPLDRTRPARRSGLTGPRSFTWTDMVGNVHDERGEIVRSRIDALLDGDEAAVQGWPRRRSALSGRGWAA